MLKAKYQYYLNQKVFRFSFTLIKYRRDIVLKKLAIVLGFLAAVVASGCMGSGLNSNPPDYVKTVSAIKEGPGLQIYFILADESGQMTTSDGKVVLKITQDGSTLFESKPFNVTKSSFEKRSVGMGNFAHDVILHLVGRIAYEDMRIIPKSGMGEVQISFTTPDGRTLEGKDTVYF